MDINNLREVILAFVPVCEQEREDRRMMLEYMDLFHNLLVRENEIAHFTASSWLVNADRTRALMVYHNIYRSWSWTGGHADGDANLLSVAQREAMEETGLTSVRPISPFPMSLEILPVPAHIKRGKYVVPHLHLNLTYALEADEKAPIHNRPEQNSAARWFTLDEAVSHSEEKDMRIIYSKLNEWIRTHE